MNIGVEDLSLEELDKLFNDDGTQETPPAENTTIPGTSAETTVTEQSVTNSSEETKAFAKRLSKKIADERESIAKSMGFNSYDEMMKSREKKVIEDKGLDFDQVAPVVDELLEQRLNNDPRIKELEKFKLKQIEEFGKRELAEITKLTGGEITQLSQLPKEVVNLWKQKGSLRSAYLELEGEKLITKLRSEQSKGSTGHLASATGVSALSDDKRLLTAEEKEIWKFFNPKITQEELDKKTINK